jgi:uncharacterized protein
MEKSFTIPITYFLQEGRDNLERCIGISFEAAQQHGIKKIVIFTAEGKGVKLALEEYCSKPEHREIKIVAVTFPQGKTFSDAEGNPMRVEIPAEDEQLFHEQAVQIVRAHLPFDPISPPFKGRGVLGQDLSLVGDALNMLGGSMSLCVQAIIVACDSGAVGLGEHVIALSSDTAILAQATSTRRMLGELVIREILCKPAVLTIGRNENADKVMPPLSRHAEAGLDKPRSHAIAGTTKRRSRRTKLSR